MSAKCLINIFFMLDKLTETINFNKRCKHELTKNHIIKLVAGLRFSKMRNINFTFFHVIYFWNDVIYFPDHVIYLRGDVIYLLNHVIYFMGDVIYFTDHVIYF
jgi:hypothetical protein